jgi:acylphosphatase
MLTSIDFKVYGKVQKVCFRKYASEQAQLLSLVGWIENQSDQTVMGQAQGSEENVAKFAQWLQKSGSPNSKIDKLEARSTIINHLQYDKFAIRK